MKTRPWLWKTSLLGSIVFALSFGWAPAHPVAQGAMDLIVHPDRIELVARISTEEVFVAGLYDTSSSGSDSVAGLLRIHGPYILDHLFLTLDGKPLKGTIVEVPRELNPKAPRSLVQYRLNFPFDHDAQPAEVELKENLLNEIAYAPGNRWEASFFVRVAQEEGDFDTGQLLTSRAPISLDVSPQGDQDDGRGRLAAEYFQFGIWHIASGYDHLLFIGALVLAVRSLWDLVKVIGAFTLAHTITLTLAVLDIVRVPEYIVQPMISASIVFVALQNIIRPDSTRGGVRLGIAFFFGLFHGLGFAGGLLNAMDDMSALSVGLAIVAFSLGVEVGHQVVVLPVYFGLRAIRNMQKDPVRRELIPRLAMRYGSVFISVAGLFYLNEALHLPH